MTDQEDERHGASDERRAVTEPAGPTPDEAPAESKARHFGTRAALLIFVAFILAQMCVGFVVGLGVGLSGRSVEAALKTWMPLGAVFGLVAGAVVIVLLTRHYLGGSIRERGRHKLGIVGASRGQTVFGCLAGALLALIYVAVARWVVTVPPDMPQGPLTQMATSSHFGFVAWVIIAIALAPPIEEFLFRGVMVHGFAQRWSPLTAATIVTLIFAVVHLPETLHYWPAMLSITILGVLTVALRLRSGSLIPALAVHVAYNVTLVMAGLFERELS